MKSIIVFTVHKAASMFLHNILMQITRSAGMNYYSPNRPASPYHFPVTKKNNDEEYAKRFSGIEGCIGPIRRPVCLPNQIDYQIVLHLRDPRDALTSMFFSYSYSHTGIDDRERERWISEGIDKFVLDKSDDFLDRYRIYCEDFVGRPNVTLVTYEEMIFSFETWLKKFIAPFPIQDVDDLTRKMIVQYKDEFRTTSEVVTSHKRKITPGDHKEKLRQETIAILNQRFGEVLGKLGYST
jgi:hypothetical protein